MNASQQGGQKLNSTQQMMLNAHNKNMKINANHNPRDSSNNNLNPSDSIDSRVSGNSAHMPNIGFGLNPNSRDSTGPAGAMSGVSRESGSGFNMHQPNQPLAAQYVQSGRNTLLNAHVDNSGHGNLSGSDIEKAYSGKKSPGNISRSKSPACSTPSPDNSQTLKDVFRGDDKSGSRQPSTGSERRESRNSRNNNDSYQPPPSSTSFHDMLKSELRGGGLPGGIPKSSSSFSPGQPLSGIIGQQPRFSNSGAPDLTRFFYKPTKKSKKFKKTLKMGRKMVFLSRIIKKPCYLNLFTTSDRQINRNDFKLSGRQVRTEKKIDFFGPKSEQNIKKQRFWIKNGRKMNFLTWRPESLKRFNEFSV